MPWKSSDLAIPCWMLLMTASSALRCSVSFNSRCVSSNSRALSSATPMLAATVLSSLISDAPNAFSRSKFSMSIVPSTRSLPRIGTRTMQSAWSVPGTIVRPRARISATLLRSSIWRDRDICDQGPSTVGLAGGIESRLPCS